MNKNQNKRNELFIKACAGGISDVVDFMLNAGGIDLNYSDTDNYTALWHAVHNKHLDIVEQLLSTGQLHQMTVNMAIDEAHKQGDGNLMNLLLEHLCNIL